jgi:DNA recombination protein RmuC
MLIAAFIVGALLGGAAIWLVMREHVAAHRRTAEDVSSSFTSLSAEALQRNNESFLQLAGSQLKPIADTLKAFDEKTQDLDRERQRAYGSLTAQVRELAEGQERLRVETGGLRTALRAPHVRGRWGEIQLKRVVELAGMLQHCDFDEQKTATDSDGNMLRPDLVVKLPGGKRVVVDAKAPLAAYLDALEAEDEEMRRVHMTSHARQVRDHITKLGAKRYWQQFEPAPEFVIMFLPDETFFRVACESDVGLFELGPESGVIPASPTTLIGLLKVFAYAWQQETIAEDTRKIAALGRELYERVGLFASHYAKLGRALDTAVGAYNQASGSLERRLLVTARKFEQHGIGGDEELEPKPIDKTTIPLTATELTRAESVQGELLPPAADAA